MAQKKIDPQHMLPAHIPFYKNRKLLFLAQLAAYVVLSVLIVNDFYPGELSVLSGLLIPGLLLTSFFSETFALIVSGILLTFIAFLLSTKRFYLVAFFVLYYLITLFLPMYT